MERKIYKLKTSLLLLYTEGMGGKSKNRKKNDIEYSKDQLYLI